MWEGIEMGAEIPPENNRAPARNAGAFFIASKLFLV